MRAFSVSELRELIGKHVPPCISLYLPTHPGGSADDRKQFEGLVRRARELLAHDLSAKARNELVMPLEALSVNGPWDDALAGLAVFHSADHSVYYRLPSTVPELAVVADTFHVRPLVGYVQTNRSYYLLNLSQNHVSLLHGDASGLGPVNLRSLPHSLTDALGFEERERSVTYHYGAAGGRPVYGGIAKSDTSRDEDLARFLRAVDRALWTLLREHKAPLVVAAPERLQSAYRAVQRYPYLAEQGIAGNFARATPDELHARAWPIVQTELLGHELEVAERYDRLVSRAMALDDVRAIAQFAVQGRVRELLLQKGAYSWGRMDRHSGALELHGEQSGAGGDDVLDDIAEAVLLRGGDVFAFEAERMPTKSPVAATLRW